MDVSEGLNYGTWTGCIRRIELWNMNCLWMYQKDWIMENELFMDVSDGLNYGTWTVYGCIRIVELWNMNCLWMYPNCWMMPFWSVIWNMIPSDGWFTYIYPRQNVLFLQIRRKCLRKNKISPTQIGMRPAISGGSTNKNRSFFNKQTIYRDWTKNISHVSA